MESVLASMQVEDMASIVSSLKPVARAAGLTWTEGDRTGAADSMLRQFFIDRCLANVHVVMVLETGDAMVRPTPMPTRQHTACGIVGTDWALQPPVWRTPAGAVRAMRPGL